MELGQTVYTVNAKTNKVDEWIFDDIIEREDETLFVLYNDMGSVILPHNAVYPTRAKALEVAKLQPLFF
jgi:hypothetical protein